MTLILQIALFIYLVGLGVGGLLLFDAQPTLGLTDKEYDRMKVGVIYWPITLTFYLVAGAYKFVFWLMKATGSVLSPNPSNCKNI